MELKQADLVVCGGTLAGCYLALCAARAGKTVVLSEMREFLGTDIVAPSALCLAPDDPRVALVGALGLLPELKDGVYLLEEGTVRQALNDLLDRAGVILLYLSSPVAVGQEEGRLTSLTLATKYGAYALAAPAAVDATGTGLLASLLSGKAPVFTDTATVRLAILCNRISDVTPRKLIERDGVSLSLLPCAAGEERAQLDLAFSMNGLGDPTTRRARATAAAYRLALELMSELMAGDEAFSRMLVEGFGFEVEILPARAARGVQTSVCGLSVLASSVSCAELLHIAELPALAAVDAPVGERYEDDALPIELASAPMPRATASLTSKIGIAGLGTGGVTAALAAAQDPGISVVALDAKHLPGGTHTIGNVGSYWHGYQGGFCALDDKERTAWYEANYPLLNIRPTVRKAVYHLLKLNEMGCLVLPGCLLFAPIMEGDVCRGVLAATEWGVLSLESEYIIDGTGDGDMAAGAGVPFTFGSLRDGMTQSYSMWGEQTNPPENFRDRLYHGDFDVIRPAQYSEYLRGLFLAMQGNSPYRISPMLTVRESRHIKGKMTVTLQDVLFDRLYPDTITVGSCPFDSHGYNNTELEPCGLVNAVKPGHHLDNQPTPLVKPIDVNECEIKIRVPYRCFLPEGVRRMAIVGKCLSADRDSANLLRMNPEIRNAGYAVGYATLLAARRGIELDEVTPEDFRAHLVEIGVLPEFAFAPIYETEPAVLVEKCREGDERACLMLAVSPRDEVLPLIREAYLADRAPLLGRALAWFGDPLAKDQMIAEAESPELASRPRGYRVALLARIAASAPETREEIVSVLAKLLSAYDPGGDYTTPRGPAYVWSKVPSQVVPNNSELMAFIYAAERIGDPALAEPLLAILAHPSFVGEHRTLDDRKNAPCFTSHTVLRLYAAAARCGSQAARDGLRAFAADRRAIFRDFARAELGVYAAPVALGN